MNFNNPLISKEGFDFIYSVLRGNFSKTAAEQLVLSLVNPPESEDVYCKNRDISLRRMRKENQYESFISLISSLGDYEDILEIASGSGELARRIAKSHPSKRVSGVEFNQDLVSKASLDCPNNVSFFQADAFRYNPDGNPDLIISLHGCGNLTDRVIDLAVEKKADVICIPCCYGKINRTESDQKYPVLPKSLSLEHNKSFFRENILKKAIMFEGIANARITTNDTLLRDAYRMLVDFDRMLYLRENDYDVAFTFLTEEKFNSSKGRKSNSPLRKALIGLKK